MVIIVCACASSRSPAAVVRSVRLLRSNSSTPNSSSSRFNCWLTAACVRFKRCAARVTLPVSTTATNARSSPTSIFRDIADLAPIRSGHLITNHDARIINIRCSYGRPHLDTSPHDLSESCNGDHIAMQKRRRSRCFAQRQAALLHRLFTFLARASEVSRQRRALMRLGDQALKDFGASRADAWHEGGRPWWDLPDSDRR